MDVSDTVQKHAAVISHCRLKHACLSCYVLQETAMFTVKKWLQDKAEISTNFTLKFYPLPSYLNGEARSSETFILM